MTLLLAAVGCGETSCPAGSMRTGDRCTAESALEGDAGFLPTEGGQGQDAARPADGVDASRPNTAPELTEERDAGRNAGADGGADAPVEAGADPGTDAAADACTDCGACDAGFVLESGVCVRNPCLASASEPALCDPKATCTYDGAGDADCACNAGYLGDGLACVKDGCVPDPGAPVPCGADASCTPAVDGSPVCACNGGYADCDASFVNGCEVRVLDDAANCGACGLSCAPGIECVSGACEPRVSHISIGIFSSLFNTGAGLAGAGAGPVIGTSATTPTLLSRGAVLRAHPYFEHACALRPAGGGAICWGKNASKELGSTVTSDTSYSISTAGLAICAGDDYSCFVAADGRVHCWGMGYLGEYGDGVTRDRSWGGRGYVDALGAPVRNVTAAVDVVCGRHLSCALTSTGRVFCWGVTAGVAYAPELIRDDAARPLNDAVAISGGGSHACAVRRDGSLVCWGDPADGRLGAGATAPAARNAFVTAAVSDVTGVACGVAHTCALLADGGVRCFGRGDNGALGAGDTSTALLPTEPLLPDGYVASAVYAGPIAGGACVTLITGQVYCWGYNYQGHLGIGHASQYEATPVEVTQWP